MDVDPRSSTSRSIARVNQISRRVRRSGLRFDELLSRSVPRSAGVGVSLLARAAPTAGPGGQAIRDPHRTEFGQASTACWKISTRDRRRHRHEAAMGDLSRRSFIDDTWPDVGRALASRGVPRACCADPVGLQHRLRPARTSLDRLRGHHLRVAVAIWATWATATSLVSPRWCVHRPPGVPQPAPGTSRTPTAGRSSRVPPGLPRRRYGRVPDHLRDLDPLVGNNSMGSATATPPTGNPLLRSRTWLT